MQGGSAHGRGHGRGELVRHAEENARHGVPAQVARRRTYAAAGQGHEGPNGDGGRELTEMVPVFGPYRDCKTCVSYRTYFSCINLLFMHAPC